MKASGKIGSNGVKVSDSVEERFEPDIYIHTAVSPKLLKFTACTLSKPVALNAFPGLKYISRRSNSSSSSSSSSSNVYL
jgi:hypothetical protein